MEAGKQWPGPLSTLLKESIGADDVEALRAAVAVSRRRPKRQANRRVPLAVAVFAVAFVVIIVLFINFGTPTHRASEIVPINGVVFSPLEVDERASAPEHIFLDEGSSIDLAPGTLLTPVRNDGQVLELRLERGRATFEVDPSTGRAWRIDAGLAEIEVVGTIFTVSRDSEQVRVSVARGQVRVSGESVLAGEQLLSMGDSLEIVPTDQQRAIADGRQSEETENVVHPEPISTEEELMTSEAHHDRGWRRAADQGDWAGAYDRLGPGRFRDLTHRSESVEELLMLADVARRSGHPAEAIEPLERMLDLYPNDRRAPVVAFTLGRLEVDQLGHPLRAAAAFRRCLSLGPPVALREDAMARLAEAYARAGRYDEAKTAAENYVRHYPEGNRAPALRRWIER